MKDFANRCLVACLGVMLALGHRSFAESEPVELVDKGGTSLTARLISSDGKILKVLRESDKKSFSLPLERLDDASSKRVQEWIDAGGNLSEVFEIDFASQRNRKNTGADDFDDKRVNMEPTISLKNPHAANATQEGVMTVIILGRPILNTSNLYVFKTESFDLKKLQPLATEVFQMESFSSPYDDRGYAKFGARYLGYVVMIHNKERTNIFSSKSVPDALVKNWGLKLLGFTEKMCYTKDLKATGGR